MTRSISDLVFFAEREPEFCQVLAGRSILRDANGEERELSAGDNFVIPSGFTGEWEVVETTRKIYVIYEP